MKAPLRSASLLPKAMPQGSGHAAAHGVVTPKISLVMSPFLTTGQVSAMVTTDGCSVTRSFLSLQGYGLRDQVLASIVMLFQLHITGSVNLVVAD